MDSKSKKKFSFDKAYQRLEEIVSLLEKDEVSIDQIEKLISEAKELHAACKEKLSTIQKKIEE